MTDLNSTVAVEEEPWIAYRQGMFAFKGSILRSMRVVMPDPSTAEDPHGGQWHIVRQPRLLPEEIATWLEFWAHTTDLAVMTGSGYLATVHLGAHEGSATSAWSYLSKVETEVDWDSVQAAAVHYSNISPEPEPRTLTDRTKAHLAERGISCGIDDALAKEYSNAPDLSIDQIRDSLAGIPTSALDHAVGLERVH